MSPSTSSPTLASHLLSSTVSGDADANTSTATLPQPPAILVSGGDVVVLLQTGKVAKVQWTNEAGVPSGPPVQLATLDDLNALRSELLGQLAALNSSTQQSAQELAGSIGAVNTALSAATSTLGGRIDATNAAVATLTTNVGINDVRQTGALRDTYANLSAVIQKNADSTASQLSTLSQTLTAQTTTSISGAVATLQAAISTKVDVGNLSVIGGYVQTVVNGMVAVNASNDLNVVLSTKLTSSPGCACFDPRAFQALASTVSALVNVSNATLGCSQQGLVYSASALGCVWSTAVPDCGSRMPALTANAVAACGLTPGSTKVGATCLASCNDGYSAGRNALFTCNASGLWVGSLSCPGKGWWG